MLLLPKKVGSYTLQRKLGTGGVAESYVGTHDTNGGRAVVVRRVLPYVLRDAARLASVEGRVRDLLGVRHPFLVHVLESFPEGDEQFLVEEYVDGVDLDKVLAWCRQNQRHIPHNVFLNIATQVCNGLEALHGRAGKGTSAEHVLHLALKPTSIFVTRDGKVMVGGYGLTRSPTTLPHGGVAGPVPTRMEYLSPEQTHPDQKLTPASDIFSLGALLFELLTLDSLFRADSNLQTIHRVRRAEVTSQLLRVKELMPGLDKVLYRALSLNPRHRYQRAFVLREDLRGLMAGYSFATIAEDTRAFLAPLLETIAPPLSRVDAAPDAPAGADSFSETPITHVDLDPMATAAAAAERRSNNLAQLDPVGVEDAGEHTEHTENTSPRGAEDPPTEVRREEAFAAHADLDRPTLPGQALAEARHEGTVVAEEPRRAPPDPTVSHPDIHRLPPPPPVQLAPPPPAEPAPPYTPISTLVPPTGPAFGAGPAFASPPFASPAPDSTAAYLAQDMSPAPTPPAAAPAPAALAPAMGFAETPAPSDTAAYLAAAPQPPSPPPVAPSPALSRPMPPPGGGPALSRPMPPPGGVSRPVPPPPKPVAAPAAPPVAAAPVAAPPTLTPPPAAPAVEPHAGGATGPLPTPQAPVYDEDFAEPPPSNGRSMLVVGGAVAALVAVLTCAGGGWFAYSTFSAGTDAVATAPDAAAAPDAATASDAALATAPAAPTAAPGDAASVMADEAPPRLEPMEDDAEALLAASAPPPAPAEVAPAPPPSTPAPTPTPAPTASTRASTPAPSAPASTASSSTASASTPTRSTTSTPTRTPTAAAPPSTASRSPASTSSPSASARAPASTSTSASRGAATSEPVVATSRTPTAREPSTASRTAPPAATFDTPMDVSVEETPVSDLDQFVDAAKKGKLQSTDVAVLEMIDAQAPDYTRSRALLLMNAQRKGDDKAARRYLDQLMVLPENQYNPVYLTDYARWHVNHAEYDKALDKAGMAERYWARIPPELVFSKKAEIYEIQAAAYQGKFYRSDEDMELLANAIKGWERYRQHVATKSRTDLQKRADAELARLQDIREKLQ